MELWLTEWANKLEQFSVSHDTITLTMWALFFLFCHLVFKAIGFKLGTWFSIVDSDFGTCFKLALSLFLSQVALALVILIVVVINLKAGFFTALGCLVLYLFILPFSIYRTFDCQKRSVLTIIVMTFLSECVMSSLLGLILDLNSK